MLVQTISRIPLAGTITKERNKIRSMIHQYHVSKGKRTHGPIFKFGIQVPRNVKEAYKLDATNGNTKWQDAMKEEIDALLMFIAFIDHGKIPHLEGYENIIVRLVFDVKHDLHHKSRLVAGGHLTDPNTDGTYSGVVNLQTHCHHCRRNEQSKDYGW
jgi:hypothetical protein